MIKAVWASENDLIVKDNDETVAKGRISESGGEWFLERAEVAPTLDCVYGDFLIRIMIRRAYELGAYEQYVYATPETEGLYQKLGFNRCINTPATKDALIKMKHTGDVRGHCQLYRRQKTYADSEPMIANASPRHRR